MTVGASSVGWNPGTCPSPSMNAGKLESGSVKQNQSASTFTQSHKATLISSSNIQVFFWWHLGVFLRLMRWLSQCCHSHPRCHGCAMLQHPPPPASLGLGTHQVLQPCRKQLLQLRLGRPDPLLLWGAAVLLAASAPGMAPGAERDRSPKAPVFPSAGLLPPHRPPPWPCCSFCSRSPCSD